MDVLIILNTITVIIAIIVCIYSYKLVLCLNAGVPSNWWGVMPIALTWAAFIRILVLADSLDMFSPDALDWIAAGQIVFWGLILIFKVGFYRELRNVLCPVKPGCK